MGEHRGVDIRVNLPSIKDSCTHYIYPIGLDFRVIFPVECWAVYYKKGYYHFRGYAEPKTEEKIDGKWR